MRSRTLKLLLVVAVAVPTMLLLMLLTFRLAPSGRPRAAPADPGRMAMLAAARAGDLPTLKQIIEEMDSAYGPGRADRCLQRGPEPESCLEAAAHGGHAAMVRFLLNRNSAREGAPLKAALVGLAEAPDDADTLVRYRAAIDLLIPHEPAFPAFENPVMLAVIAGLPDEALRLVQGQCDNATAYLFHRARSECKKEVMDMLGEYFEVKDLLVAQLPGGIARPDDVPKGFTRDNLIARGWYDRRTAPGVDGVPFLDLMLLWESNRGIRREVIGQTVHDECGQILRHLIEAGADPNTCYGRRTPLHTAVLAGNSEAITTLLEHGADPDAVDFEGKTPQELAASPEDLALFGHVPARPEP